MREHLKFCGLDPVNFYVVNDVHAIFLISGYTLSYMRKNDSTTRVEKTFGPKIESYTINELAPTTTYTIEVYCSTRVGPGAALSADIDSGIPPGN